jgi:predicted RNA-binding protein
MLFRVYLEKELFMEKVRIVKANSEGVALKDDSGATRVLDGVYVAEVESVAGFITLRHVQPVARGP